VSEKERNRMKETRLGIENAALSAISFMKSAAPASRQIDSLVVVTFESQTREHRPWEHFRYTLLYLWFSITALYVRSCGTFRLLQLSSHNTWLELSVVPITHIWWYLKSHMESNISTVYWIPPSSWGSLWLFCPLLMLHCGQGMVGNSAIKPSRHSKQQTASSSGFNWNREGPVHYTRFPTMSIQF
jgi:hypothetical protein